MAICFPPVSIVVFPGVGYPQRLTALGWTPDLHVDGVLAGSGSAVAIVGARAATGTGMVRAHAIARHCATRGIHVVSGGALGIDGAAHRGALEGGGTTTVVLGSGVDVRYPARHAALFDQIAARGGALVSMLPLGTEPRRGTFLARNKLIAALADVTIVIEASLVSGSLVTARHATRLGRVVAAWPGSAGCERLLAEGAAIIEDERDVIAALAGAPRMRAPRVIDPIEACVASAIASGATTVDAIAQVTGLSVRAVVRALPLVRKS